ncbi:MAG TPA: hypothetical protein VK866_19280 [Acidimicrobiales bacterium]|nr:hypothetical protein [Acidimicrobiales bacterium]
MQWYVVLFYLWLLVSVVILVRRSLGRAAGRAERQRLEPEAPLPSPVAHEWPRPDAVLAAPTPTVARPPSAPTSLAELLAGIHLPADLAPLTHLGAIPDDGRLVLITASAPAEVVARELADELERLGFAVASLTETVAVARAERGAVEIEVHPDPATATVDGARRFPTAEPGTVVVELRPV